jgi:phospholipid/cholesterol/gamma-HCH transport system permease protein
MPIWLETIEPNLAIDPQQSTCLLATGDWTFQHANALISLLSEKRSGMDNMDARSINRLDATGSQLLMAFLRRQGISEHQLAAKPEHQALIDAVLASSQHPPAKGVQASLYIRILEAVGAFMQKAYANTLIFHSFLGQTLLSAMINIVKPKHWRITSVVFHMQAVGLNAVPLVMLLSFMIGAVVAFLGATVLSEFGAELWVVELVGVAFMREFGVLLTPSCWPAGPPAHSQRRSVR